MRLSSGGIGIFARARLLPAAVMAAWAVVAISAPAASANNLFTLEGNPEIGAVPVTESAGTAYVAWERKPANSGEADITLFCRIPRGGTCTSPIVLPLPSPGTSGDEGVTQAYAVLGTRPGVVYVVGPRYGVIPSDTLIWTSTNGGASFSSPVKSGSYGGKTGIDDVLLNPKRTASEKEPTSDYFDVASTNAGLAFGEVGNLLKSPADFGFSAPWFYIYGGSLGFTTGSQLPVEAFVHENAEDHFEVAFFANKGSPTDTQANWTAPTTVGEGQAPRLASGRSGLFMLSSRFSAGSGTGVLELRKFDEANDTFEAPAQIAGDVGTEGSAVGIYENPETGYLYVVWPESSGGNISLHLEESTDGGASFHGEREVALAEGGFEGPPRLAVASDGRGWLTYRDEHGDEVADLTVNTILSTSLTGGGQGGASITVPQGTTVADTATVGGGGGSSATGSVTYDAFSNPSCTGAATSAGSAGVSGGAAGSSAAITLPPGKYWWQASYSGDSAHEPSTSPCGSEVLTVLGATATSTSQSGGGISGAALTVDYGTTVTDQARISGALASSATGTVTYTLYKNSKCTSVDASSSESVAGGVGAHSAAVKPKVGTYYWKATYSGDSANEGSVSACGSEVLIVAEKAELGLPSPKVCLSRRKFIVHPRAPRGVRLVSVEIQINGKTVKKGRIYNGATTVSLVGLPKGTFVVSLITKSSKGQTYADIRTFHTCVAGKHKKKK